MGCVCPRSCCRGEAEAEQPIRCVSTTLLLGRYPVAATLTSNHHYVCVCVCLRMTESECECRSLLPTLSKMPPVCSTASA